MLNRSIRNVECEIHKKEHLAISKSTFKLICSKCETQPQKDGKVKQNLICTNLQTTSRKHSMEIESEDKCDKHKSVIALFFCEDCKKTCCCECFNDHRSHNCNTPERISAKYDALMKEMSEKLAIIKKVTESNLDNLKPVLDFYKSIKEKIKVGISASVNRVNTAVLSKSTFFRVESEELFKGIDKEVEEALLILDGLKQRMSDTSSKLKGMVRTLSQLKSDSDICFFKKKHAKEIYEIESLIVEVESYLYDKLKQTKLKAEQHATEFDELNKILTNKIKAYENTLFSTLQSGISSTCYRVRRFKQFFSYEIAKYFRNSAVCLMVNKSISLCGLGICGLFLDNLYKKVDPLLLRIEIVESKYVIKDNDDTSKGLKKEIKVEIMNKEVKVPGIKNIIDPAHQIYFDKAVSLSKDKVYNITIKNMSGEDFVKIWSGSIEDEAIQPHPDHRPSIGGYGPALENFNQTVVCNDTYVKFNTVTAYGFESDYNEFTMGLISDFIYSYSG